jgi:hypothetical protein
MRRNSTAQASSTSRFSDNKKGAGECLPRLGVSIAKEGD